MPDISGELGTGSVGTAAPERAVSLSGWFSRGRFVNLTGTLGTAALGTIGYISGNTIYAASLSYADVMTAYNLCGDGDTLVLPAGSVSWTSSSMKLILAKPGTLQGQGQGVTNITITFSASGNGAGIENFSLGIIPSSPSSNPHIRMTGISWNFQNSGGLTLYNSSDHTDICNRIRIDHCDLDSLHMTLIHHGAMYGCIDNCTIKGHMDHTGGTTGWTADPYYFGSQNQLYFEDVVFTNHAGAYELWHAGNGSNRYCFRHCTIGGSPGVLISPLFDIHGNTGSGTMGGLGWEIYENTITFGANTPVGALMDLRGGKGLIYGNTMTIPNGSAVVRCREEHLDGIDGYPTHSINGQPQHISDTYTWLNTCNGSRKNMTTTGEYVTYPEGVCPTENLHFWNQNDSFNGSVGIGVGLLSARPSSGLTAGVGYWATDTQILYRAVNSTTWASFYTPYAYPHPHRSDSILGD